MEASITAIPVRTPPQPAVSGISRLQAAPSTTSPEDELIGIINKAAGRESPWNSEEMRADARKLLPPSGWKPGQPLKPWIRQKDVAAFLKKYYEVDKVTDQFWAAFTGLDEDAVIDTERLKTCFRMFEKYHRYSGASLKYMAEHKNIYIVPAEGLKDAIMNYQGGISKLLADSAANPFIRRAWESAKFLTGDKAGDLPEDNGKHSQETYKWFSIILSTNFAEKLAGDKAGKKDIEDLSLDKNRLLVDIFDKFLLRWMVGEEGGPGKGRQKIGDGISKAEWKGLLKMQDTIESIGSRYYKNDDAIKDLRLVNAKAGTLWNEAVQFYEADSWISPANGPQVQRLIGQIRKIMDGVCGQAAPEPALALLQAK